MMKRHWGAVLLSLIAFLSLCNSVTADTTYDGDPALISIDIENGEYSSETILFSGIIEDDEQPSDVFWRVAKDGAEFDGGDMLGSLVEITSTSSREQWSWSVSYTHLTLPTKRIV